jgi:hypothetical protein
MASEVEIEINSLLLDVVKETRQYAESEVRRFFELQRKATKGSTEQANYRGQYSMAQRMLTHIDNLVRGLADTADTEGAAMRSEPNEAKE